MDDFNGLGLFNPIGMHRPPPDLTLPPHRESAPETHGTGAVTPPQDNLGLSDDLKALCQNLSDAAQARRIREAKPLKMFAAYRQPNLTGALKAASKSEDVTSSSPHKQGLRDSFEADHRPVIFLDSDGFPEYVFVHVDGEWRGFDGAFRRLPGTPDPVAAMMNINGRAQSGMWFTRYVVKGDFQVIQHAEVREEPGDGDSVHLSESPLLFRSSSTLSGRRGSGSGHDNGDEGDETQSSPRGSQLSLPLSALDHPLPNVLDMDND